MAIDPHEPPIAPKPSDSKPWKVGFFVLAIVSAGIIIPMGYFAGNNAPAEFTEAQKARVYQGYIGADYFCKDQNLPGELGHTDARNTRWTDGLSLTTTYECHLTDGRMKEYIVTSDQETMQIDVCETFQGKCIPKEQVLGPEAPA